MGKIMLTGQRRWHDPNSKRDFVTNLIINQKTQNGDLMNKVWKNFGNDRFRVLKLNQYKQIDFGFSTVMFWLVGKTSWRHHVWWIIQPKILSTKRNYLFWYQESIEGQVFFFFYESKMFQPPSCNTSSG